MAARSLLSSAIVRHGPATVVPNAAPIRAIPACVLPVHAIPTRPSSSQTNNRPASTPSSTTAAAAAAKGANGSSASTLTSYLTTLRLRAASALTSTLPPAQRSALLESLNAVDTKSAESNAAHSIGEAVAAAVREEAERNATKFLRERTAIEARAERAATERVKHEVLIEEQRRKQRQDGLDRWKREVEAEEREEQLAKSDHPILGSPVVDLGYKRVHVVTARSLAAVPIWEKQRVYRHDRARAMAADKTKTADLGLPGIVTLHEAEDGQLSILDGQHRVGMMAILQERAKSAGPVDKNGDDDDKDAADNDNADQSPPPLNGLDLDRILVEVFPAPPNPETRPKHAEDIFTEINKAEPVKLVDMPGVAKSTERRSIDGAAEALRKSYPDMFKPSQRCRSPHLNVDNLRDALFAADVLKRHGIKSDKAMVDWLMEKNADLGKRFAEEGANGGGKGAGKAVSKSALAKAEKFQFFLGLDSAWLYQ